MSVSRVDVAANRKVAKYSRNEQVRRVLWALAAPLFHLSPRPCFGWRRFLLRSFGACIGNEVHIYPSAHVRMPWQLEIGDWSSVGEDVLIYNLGKVTIGSRATLSLRAHLCAGTHDYTRPDMPLLKTPIHVGDDVWVCADAFVGPGVDVGANAIVAARAVVMKNVPPGAIVAGNPARVVATRGQ